MRTLYSEHFMLENSVDNDVLKIKKHTDNKARLQKTITYTDQYAHWYKNKGYITNFL